MNTDISMFTKKLKQSLKSIWQKKRTSFRHSFNVLPTLKELTIAYEQAGLNDIAQQVEKLRLAVITQEPGSMPLRNAIMLQNIGDSLQARGLFDDAERFYLSAVFVKRQTGASLAQLTDTYFRLVNLYHCNGNYMQAELAEAQLANLCREQRLVTCY